MDPSVTPSAPPVQSPPSDRVGGVAAPTLVQSIVTTPPVVPEPQVPARGKEFAPPSEVVAQEVATGAQALEKEPIPPEVEVWMEKVGHEASEVKLESLPPVQVPLPPSSQSSSAPPQFVLPLGQQEMQMGLHASVNDSIRWLATWARRVMKQLGGGVLFRNTQ